LRLAIEVLEECTPFDARDALRWIDTNIVHRGDIDNDAAVASGLT
jgi:hypothetical protein